MESAVSSRTSSALDVARATGGNVSSMRADILRGARTEIERINGAIVQIAGADKAPVNAALASAVGTLQSWTSGQRSSWRNEIKSADANGRRIAIDKLFGDVELRNDCVRNIG